jgi:hypothetical protein
VKLMVQTTSAPAQGGKTTLNITSEMLPVDVPVPAEATRVEYVQSLNRLTYDVKLSGQECLDFHRASLAKLGWETKTDAPARVQADTFVMFYNADKDVLRLGLRPAVVPGAEGFSVVAEYLTGQQIAEMKAKYDAQVAAQLEAAKK